MPLEVDEIPYDESLEAVLVGGYSHKLRLPAALRIEPNYVGKNPSRSILAKATAGGATVELCPAPPAGYVNVIPALKIHNEHATLAAMFRVLDSSGPPSDTLAISGNVNALLDGFFVTGLAIPLVSDQAIKGEVTGSGGPGVFYGWYCVVPKGDMILSRAVLTNTFAPIADLVVPAGYDLRPWPPAANMWISNSQSVNADSATAALEWRVTRGGVQYTGGQTNLTQLVSRSAGVTIILPQLEPGDIIEARVVAAPVVPGSVTLNSYWMPVRRA